MSIYPRISKIFNIMLLATLLASITIGSAAPFKPPAALAAAVGLSPQALDDFGTPVVDGVIDAIYGDAIASDLPGDGNGNAVMDLLDLYAAQDETYLYFAFTINANVGSTNWGKYVIYLDTTNDGTGAANDAWGRNVTVNDPHKPEYSIYTYLDSGSYGPEDTQFWQWDGSWAQNGMIANAAVGAGSTSVIEWQIAKSAVGNPDIVWLEVWGTGGGGGDNAQDTINDPANDWNAINWSTQAVLSVSTPYALSDGPLSLDVTSPDEGGIFAAPNIAVTGTVSPTVGVTLTVGLNGTALFTPTIAASSAFTQALTLVHGNNTITVNATDGTNTRQVVRHVSYGASHDNNIWWSELGHNSRDSLYRTPFGAVVTGTTVTLRLRAAENDLTGVKLRLFNARTDTQTLANMTRATSDGIYEYWEYQLAVGSEPTVYWYRFIPTDGSETAYYEDDEARTGGWGKAFDETQDYSWQLTVYDPAYETPDWVKNAVIYQVFTDRFRDGEDTNDTPAGTFFYNEAGGTIFRSNDAGWNAPICDPRDASDPTCAGTYSRNFYGGDLQGIIDKLDYLQTLGVTAIYLNPIFESPSNHKYDTTDFGVIDDNFGDLTTFYTLTTEADSRGIKLILDGVFNHSSSDSLYFDRYGRYPSLGACESNTSPYRDWYYFTDVTPGSGPCVSATGVPNAATYDSWWGYDSLPKLRANSQPVRDLIWANGTSSIGPYWIEQGAAGWRLDVGGDVDSGLLNDAANDYWEGFRAAVRDVYTGTYITGEEWGNASSWLLGNEWDAVMNYQYSTAMLGFYRDTTFTDNDHNTGSSAGPINPLDPSELDERLLNWIERYPPEALYAMMNLLGSHDTSRALFMLDHNAANGTNDTLLDNPDYDWSDAITRLKGVALLQMTLPGAPTIYYGDEVGTVGPITYAGGKWEDDPYNRVPYPWLDQTGVLPFYTFLQSQASQDALSGYYGLLANTRNATPALRTGSFDPLLMDDAHGIYAYGRKLADHSSAALVVLSRASGSTGGEQTVSLDVDGYLPYGAEFVNVLDSSLYTVTVSGTLVVDAPDQSGVLLIPSATIAAPPDAVTDLAVIDVGNAAITLDWNAASDADRYDIYRSLLSGGGYELITHTVSTVYTDTGLLNATRYYYVAVSRNDGTGLVSGYSNEAAGMPQHDLSAAWYNLQSPQEFTHTISAITATQDIAGQLWINGFTGGSGPAEGIRAQVGYGISGTATTTWEWVEMEYDQAAGSNDQYAGNLLPDAVGDYQYATRWSSDNAETWLYADLSGPGHTGEYGLMHVIPSNDLTAPSAPQTLTVTATTANSISLAWDANAETDLAGYDAYRQLSPLGGFARIARLFGDPTAYTDNDAITDQTYNYYLVAFDTGFNFSAASNIITATAEARYVAVTFDVTVPSFTPGTVYIAGSIPGVLNWYPDEQALNQVDSTHWTLTLQILDGTEIQYKYTRGTWDTVEKEADGNTEINDRQVTIEYGANGTQLIEDTIANWRDPLVVASIPNDGAENVPVSSTIGLVWSQDMITTTDFTVSGPAGEVAGTLGYDAANFTATFTPTLGLAASTTYTITTSGKKDAGNDSQQVPFQSVFTTSPGRTVAVTFDVNVPGFTPGTVSISGTVGEHALTQANSSHWTTTLQLPEGASIEYLYTRGSQETLETAADGNTAIATRQVTISYGTDGTQIVEDTVANWLDPIVVAASPLDGATDVPVTSTISLRWSQAMPANTNFVVNGPSGVVSGTFGYDAATFTVTFTPTLPLAMESTYTISAAGKQDAGGDMQQVPFRADFHVQAEVAYRIFLPLIFKNYAP